MKTRQNKRLGLRAQVIKYRHARRTMEGLQRSMARRLDALRKARPVGHRFWLAAGVKATWFLQPMCHIPAHTVGAHVRVLVTERKVKR